MFRLMIFATVIGYFYKKPWSVILYFQPGVLLQVNLTKAPAISAILITDKQIWYLCVGLLNMYGYILLCTTYDYVDYIYENNSDHT